MEIITNLDPIVQAVLRDVLLALLSAFVGGAAWTLTRVWKNVTSQAGTAELELINSIVADAVHYAEQTGLRDKLVNAGAEKKKRAEQYAVDFLKKYGITLTAEDLDKLVEQAVHKEFNF